MRDPNRIDRILELLRKYWHEHPDLRLAQLVHNLDSGNGYNQEDSDLEQILRRELKRRT